MSSLPPGLLGLSLQERLDRISKDRAVLNLRRDLARLGLHDGDRVSNRARSASGQLVIVQTAEIPFAAVTLDDGTRVDFAAPEWLKERT